jgi:hypothetical protein
VDVGLPDAGVGEYERRLRELLVAALDLKRIRSDGWVGDGAQLRREIVLVAEHLHHAHAAALGPAGAEPAAVRAAVADDIAGWVEQGRWDRLRPTAWATRELHRRWYERSWVGRAWHVICWRLLAPAWHALWVRHRARG